MSTIPAKIANHTHYVTHHRKKGPGIHPVG